MQNSRHVVACIPYYRCQPYIRRAVDSLLAQTHRDLTVVVVNDADFDTPPWPALADIRDPRLVRFDLPQNQGPYYALSVALKASPAAYFLVQDADDWSHPERVSCLLAALKKEKGDYAVSAQPQYRQQPDSSFVMTSVTLSQRPDSKVSSDLTSRLPHHGLFRASMLRQVGGYYGGFRIGYDRLITNLTLMTGRIAYVSFPLYHRFVRMESLTRDKQTGIGTEIRCVTDEQIAQVYSRIYPVYRGFLSGKVSSGKLLSQIQQECSRSITTETACAMQRDVERLSKTWG